MQPAAEQHSSLRFKVNEHETEIGIDAYEAVALVGQVLLEKGTFAIPEFDGAVAEGRRLPFDAEMRTGPTLSSAPSFGDSDETAYSCEGPSGTSSPYAGCGACTYPTSQTCLETGCKEFTGSLGQKNEFVSCDGPGLILQRACTVANGSTACGIAGPNGCAVCWTKPQGGYDVVTVSSNSYTGYCTWRECSYICNGVPC